MIEEELLKDLSEISRKFSKMFSTFLSRQNLLFLLKMKTSFSRCFCFVDFFAKKKTQRQISSKQKHSHFSLVTAGISAIFFLFPKKLFAMKLEVLVLLFAVESFVQGQSYSEYQPTARGGGGHFISNGKYQNQAPPQQSNYNLGPPSYNNYQPQTSNNVIGNTAENIFGRSAVNSIINSRFAESAVNSIAGSLQGSANNVIGNKASNVYGNEPVNSFLNNP